MPSISWSLGQHFEFYSNGNWKFILINRLKVHVVPVYVKVPHAIHDQRLLIYLGIPMLFRHLQDQEYPILLSDNVTVKFVSEHKHLGLTFSENMKWKCQIDSIY